MILTPRTIIIKNQFRIFGIKNNSKNNGVQQWSSQLNVVGLLKALSSFEHSENIFINPAAKSFHVL